MGIETFKAIGNKLGRFIDKTAPRTGLHTCAQIYLELNLEGLPKAIELQIDNWTNATIELQARLIQM